MRLMADLLESNRPPAQIMRWYVIEDAKWKAEADKIGRNEPCPCGSGRKTKHCHGRDRD